ncbi:hypothetical protein APF79_14035 [bacterium BRH_c32]|nr:MAG: hypothetical protein APF79_14035 [bacterium BRH_c32]
MIKQAQYNLSLTRNELKQLAQMKDWTGKQWENKSKDEFIISIKTKIRRQLEDVQKTCCYCGLKLRGTSKGDIDHIAAKARFRHPEFTFTLKNLALACGWSNTSEKKGTKETIAKKNKVYSKCEFLLVHPYFDNPVDHYEWTDSDIEILIQVKNNSSKASFSIKMFGLDTTEMSELRAAQVSYEKKKLEQTLSVNDEDLVKRTMEYKQP